jgi:hypothetical protein
MNIVVCVKQIPDPATPGALDSATNALKRDGKLILDESDGYGVEMALQLVTTAGSGEVSVVSMAPNGEMSGMRTALAMGAVKGLLVSDPALAGSDALTTAKILAAAVTKLGGADLIITATGFNLSVLGEIPFVVDDKSVDFAQTVTYRGMMFTGVPNMAWVFGYFRASWTLRVDLMGDFICRLLQHMDETHSHKVTPQLRPQDAEMPIGSWMDPENFNPNYLMRSQHLMPKRGNVSEWQHNQDYWVEREILPSASLVDGCLTYS